MATKQDTDGVSFYPLSPKERAHGNKNIPKHRSFTCGACGNTTNGRIVCDYIRSADGAEISWLICSCENLKPSVMIERQGQLITQVPNACDFRSGNNWPPDLAKLYDEGAKSYSAGAYTATSMACRKLLMACACHEGDDDGKPFVQYVDYITGTVLAFPRAKDAIDAIRTIGNDANHHVQFVGPDDAKRAMQIVTCMLNTIYSLPSA